MQEILKYDLKDYLDKNLATRYSFCRKLSSEKIMKWSSTEIATPLTKLSMKEYHSVAIQLYRSKLI
jgi:hypothetical protein